MTSAGTTRTAHGTCTLCEAMCGLEYTVTDEGVQSVRGDKKDPLSRGHICPKATALVDILNDPDRVRRPLQRTETGWREIGWDEAVDLVARRLSAIRDEHGADAVGVYAGNPNVHSLGAMTHGIPFLSMLRTRNRYSATSLDQLPHQLTNMLFYGHQLRQPIADIDNTDFFLVLGANPMASNGSMMTVPDFGKRVKELRARGGRMVVIDPRRTETADVADTHHFIRPGTDAHLLLALVHVVLADGAATPAPYVDGVEGVTEAVAAFTPEAVAPLTGIDADVIRTLARDLTSAGSAAVYGRMGVSTQEFGTVCQWAVHVLNILTGNLDRVGGVLFTDPAVDLIANKITGRGHFDKWRSRVRDLPEFSGELPASTLVDEMNTDGPGRVRAMVVASGNPVLSMPGGPRLDEAFAGLDFMVSFDIYVNETSRHADIILPSTVALERDHYDLIFSTFAVRNTAKFNPAVLPKEAEARHDWEIFRDLSLRYAAVRRRGPRARTLGRVNAAAVVREVRTRLSPARTVELLLLRARGVTLRTLRKNPHGTDLGPLRPGLPGKLLTRDRRVALMHDVITPDIDRLRNALLAATPRADGELLLIGRRHVRSNNSWMHNAPRLVKGKPRHGLLAHPADLDRLGISDGDTVEVVSAAGSVRIEVTASDSVMPGVVSIPHGFGHDRDGVRLTVARDVRGPSVNDLTDPDRVEGVAGNAVLNGVPVTLRPVGTADQDTSSRRVPSTSSERRVGSSTGGQMA
ncbi:MULTISPECIES: molybdopterin-dependent oxidoreductase [Nocardiaceae]|uniref:Anaerobic selenocysteine-containing dehydrogenase n=1 Tax=Rhodococcoides corynebacterioides TaxID=53972 RepID=A0ABS2KTW3_9NOCA|nr:MULTISPECIES: molybdopterin-dependent oxidoreductase [Rhodococcus]MBM7415236.1 anaerobic selenocysteine-containing dehydrogenase [Rhodococcus corynebacterioides]MBP1117698.1 anaerobic selenocysteine-containing dehydrogenase [Rhodococcus sp. PvP016]